MHHTGPVLPPDPDPGTLVWTPTAADRTATLGRAAHVVWRGLLVAGTGAALLWWSPAAGGLLLIIGIAMLWVMRSEQRRVRDDVGFAFTASGIVTGTGQQVPWHAITGLRARAVDDADGQVVTVPTATTTTDGGTVDLTGITGGVDPALPMLAAAHQHGWGRHVGADTGWTSTAPRSGVVHHDPGHYLPAPDGSGPDPAPLWTEPDPRPAEPARTAPPGTHAPQDGRAVGAASVALLWLSRIVGLVTGGLLLAVGAGMLWSAIPHAIPLAVPAAATAASGVLVIWRGWTGQLRRHRRRRW